MSDDPEFTKDVKVEKPRPHEAYEDILRDKASKAFDDAKKQDEERAKNAQARSQQAEQKKADQPKLEYDMKGAIGSAVKAKVAEENAIRRSKALAVQRQGAAMEQDAKARVKGAIEDAKSGRDPTSAVKSSVDLSAQANKAAQTAELMERVNRLKFAFDHQDQAKSKDEC